MSTYLSPDLTLKERAVSKKLYLELKDRREKHEKDLTIKWKDNKMHSHKSQHTSQTDNPTTEATTQNWLVTVEPVSNSSSNTSYLISTGNSTIDQAIGNADSCTLGNLKIFYTNCGQFLNKRDDLLMCIADEFPRYYFVGRSYS